MTGYHLRVIFLGYDEDCPHPAITTTSADSGTNELEHLIRSVRSHGDGWSTMDGSVGVVQLLGQLRTM